MRVLLADDEIGVRTALRIFFEEEGGFEIVSEATRGGDLLLLAQHTHPDLIIIDWELAGMIPSAFPSPAAISMTVRANQMRAVLISSLQRLTPLPFIIVLSNYSEAFQTAITSGADDFFCKSEPPDHLISLLRTIKS